VALNILIVDDSSVVRHMIRKTLGACGLDLGEVTEAENGQAGLEALQTHWVDLVLVDINMPVMTGEEMILQLRRNPLWADLPIIVVSTEGSQTRIERLQREGARFVHKPFAPEAVRQAIVDLLGANHANTP
jgi:two-component system, chemotaxis family, chemotaxis protein CheY